MKIANAALSFLLIGAAIAAVAGCLHFMSLIPRLPLASLWNDILPSPNGNLVYVVIVGVILALKLRPTAKPVGHFTRISLLLLALVPPVSAGLRALQKLSNLETSSRALGGVSMVIRAPEYAEVCLIIATGLAAGAIGSVALAILQRRRV